MAQDKKNSSKLPTVGSEASEALESLAPTRKLKNISKRKFLKTAALATAGITAAGGLSLGISSLIPYDSCQQKYAKDVIPGDMALAKREYVEMTKAEKKNMVRRLKESYKKQKNNT
ncbi:MAG: hypothetical protein V3T30_07545 [Thermodesulfobacteriota bacterium]